MRLVFVALIRFRKYFYEIRAERTIMFGRVYTSAIAGIDGREVVAEADFGDGLPSFEMVGDLGNEVKEARERVRAALKNVGIVVPPGKLTVNLSPAHLKKSGNSFDLPIAVAVMVAIGVIPQAYVEDISFIGELALDGGLRPVNGTLSHVLCARDGGRKCAVIPKGNAREGAVIRDISVFGFQNLTEVMTFLLDRNTAAPEACRDLSPLENLSGGLDFSEIRGQESVKRAAMVAAAGMHGMLMVGPPGTGKTLTAKRIPTILPPLSQFEQIECSKIHSVAGTLDPEEGLIRIRPFRSPHHTVSANGLAGGGAFPRPGEMSLAHNGVLFLDELPEFSKMTLEAMRQPLEDKKVTISRVNGTYTFPTRMMLVCAMNPCRCGYYPDRNKCHCSEGEVRKYLSRISKPLLDRIDILAEVPRVPVKELSETTGGTDSETLRKCVIRAWEIQKERYQSCGILFNSQLEGAAIRKYCVIGKAENELLKEVFDKMDLSARAHDRIIKVSRTIADLEESERITTQHLSEAIGYRSLDRKLFGGL